MEEKKSPKESEGSAKRPDLIIITPEELIKLGLFKNVDASKTKDADNIVTDPNIISLKRKIAKSLKSSLQSTKDVQNKQKNVKTNTNQLNKDVLSASEMKNSASTSQAPRSMLNRKSSQKNLLHSQKLPLKRNVELDKNLYKKGETQTKNIPATVLNSAFKFEKCGFILAQKKNNEKHSESKTKVLPYKMYDKTSKANFNKEIPKINTTMLQNKSTDSANNSKNLDTKMSNSRYTIINTEEGTAVEQVNVRKGIKETVNKKLKDTLTKSGELKNITKIKELPLDLNSPTTSTGKESSILENNVQNNKIILKEVITNNYKLIGDKSNALNSDEICILNNNKKGEDVNIVSNVPVHFSKEELSKLVSVAKSKFKKTGPVRLIALEEEILSAEISETSEKGMLTSAKSNNLGSKNKKTDLCHETVTEINERPPMNLPDSNIQESNAKPTVKKPVIGKRVKSPVNSDKFQMMQPSYNIISCSAKKNILNDGKQVKYKIDRRKEKIAPKECPNLEKNSEVIINNVGQKDQQKTMITQPDCKIVDISKTNDNLENQLKISSENQDNKILSTNKKNFKGPIKYLIKERHKETNMNNSIDVTCDSSKTESTTGVGNEKKLNEAEKYKREETSIKNISILPEKKEANRALIPVKIEEVEDEEKIHTKNIENIKTATVQEKQNGTKIRTLIQIRKRSCEDENKRNFTSTTATSIQKETNTPLISVKVVEVEDTEIIHTNIENIQTENVQGKQNEKKIKTVTQIRKRSCEDEKKTNSTSTADASKMKNMKEDISTNNAGIHGCGNESDLNNKGKNVVEMSKIQCSKDDIKQNISKDESIIEDIQPFGIVSFIRDTDVTDKRVEKHNEKPLKYIKKETNGTKEEETKLVISFKDSPKTGRVLNNSIYDECKKEDSIEIASSSSTSKCKIEKNIDVPTASISTLTKAVENRKEIENITSSTPKASAHLKNNISIPKKRGRPRKVINLNNDEATPDYSNLQISSDENQSLSEIKKQLENSAYLSRSPQKDISNIKTDQLSEVTDALNSELLSDKGPLAMLPRKRGRPRKIQNIEETDKESNTSLPIKINDEEVIQEEKQMSSPLPRKRGRKRKSELPPVVIEEIVETFDTSKSGRKRKKIDYFELENKLEEENDGSKKRRKLNPHRDYEKSFEVTKNTENNFTNSSSNESSEKVNEVIEEGKHCVVKAETVSTDASTTNQCFYKTDNALMMNSVFHAAVRNHSKVEDSGGDAKQLLESYKPKKRGRKSKKERTHSLQSIEIDQGNMEKCVRCRKNISTDDWLKHNRKLHCNLSWRNGEQELNFNNKESISNILKPILQEEKVLHCNDCQKTYTTTDEFITHIAECRGFLSSDCTVTCAVCNQSIEKRRWAFHKQSQHNNLAWKHGDSPLDLNNQSLVVSILTALYKAKKPLYCYKCKTSKKSVVGFLSHQSQCGLSANEAKVQCKFCEKKVLPVSMATHIKFVHETPKEEPLIKSTYLDVEMDAIPTKRRAARTAMQVIDQFTKEKTFQERARFYIEQLDFAEELFVKYILKKQLLENHMVKCKFKDCELEYDKCKTLINHMNSCEKKPNQYYTCKKCLFITEAENEIKEHLKTDHKINTVDDSFIIDGIKKENDDVDDDDEDDDEERDLIVREMKKRKLFEKRKSEKDINYKIKPTCLLNTSKQPGRLFYNAFSYTIDFCEENFSRMLLFNHLRNAKSNWLLLENDLIEAYLPKSGVSCGVAKKMANSVEEILEDEFTFKKFELFDTQCEQGTAMIFCGGPINAMAWLPTPYTSFNYNQILAVATAKDFDVQYKVGVNYREPSVIQFWDFGALRNKNHENIAEPQLLFCLTYEFGPVWHMEWCPSGCCDNLEKNELGEVSRMGLLAVAGSDSIVHIYSLPFLKTEEKELIYSAKPLLKLNFVLKNGSTLGQQNFFATKISWSKASGHRYIAVGYTNGMVALFDLECTSKILCYRDDDGVNVLLPYKSFQAHTDHITALTLIYLGGGNRWMFTGSFDYYHCIWDLHNDIKLSEVKKQVVTDGAWLTNWLANITGAEESSTKYAPVHTCLTSFRDYLYDHVHVTISPTTVKSLSSSDWLNSILQGSAAGEITGLFPHQLLYSVDSKKHFKMYSYMFGYTKLIDLHKTPEERIAEETEKIKALKTLTYKSNKSDNVILSSETPYFNEPFAYEEASKKYGLVFCDMEMNNCERLVKATQEATTGDCKKLEISKGNLYPLKAVNIVSYNPNLQASLYFATGYQAGFVRLTYIKMFEKDKQIK